jgi:hypothetical protein
MVIICSPVCSFFRSSFSALVLIEWHSNTDSLEPTYFTEQSGYERIPVVKASDRDDGVNVICSHILGRE